MTVNIEVKGDPAAIQAVGYALNPAGVAVKAARAAVVGAGLDSTTWTGHAGNGFRYAMTKLGGIANSVAGKVTATGTALVTYGGELQAVKNKMAAAKQVAVTGGLTTTATHIMPPGPAPQPTAPLAARNAYVTKVRAYSKAAKAVSDARLHEQRIQRALAAGPLKDLATATDLGIGATVGAAATSSRLRVSYQAYDALATRAARLARSANATDRAAALQKLANFAITAERYRVAAEGNLVARFGAAQPQWVKTMLTKPVVGQAPRTTPAGVRAKPTAGNSLPGWLRVVKDGAKVGGRVPLVGIGLAAVGVGLDIVSGTDPLKAVASGVAGVVGGVVGGAIGAAAGASIGGAITGPAAPAGAAVGGVVGGIVGGFLVGSAASGAVEQAFG